LQRNNLRSISWPDCRKDTPTETAQNLTNNKDWLVGREESNEDEGIQEEESNNDDFAIAIFGGEPSVQEYTRHNTDVTSVTAQG
jgi:hypothetical protein